MAYMHFATASGKFFTLNSRQYEKIAWALWEGQIAETRLVLMPEKDAPYQRYRVKRLGANAPSAPTDYAIAIRRSSQKDMDRMDESSFAKLDSVIIALSKQPMPPECIQIKYLRPDLRIIRGAECVVVYAIDSGAKRLRILKVGYYGKKRKRPAVAKARVPAPAPRPKPASADKGPSPIDLDWQDGYSGQTAEELLSFEKYGRTDLLVRAFTEAIQEKVERRGRLSEAERVVLAVGKLDSTMVTDGFDNFFMYSPQFASTIVDSLRLIGCKRLAKATERAVDALRLINVRAKTERLDKCSMSYWKAPGPTRRLFAFIKANRDSIRL
jgi:mRNA-degrading endonuclease RelE of RelBE toxin-antitoxin system